MSMAEFRLTPAAEKDLESIWVYTFQQWGVDQANHYTDRLTAALAQLAQSPTAAPAVDHIRSGYRCRSVGRHRIYFRIAVYGIEVIRILHDRMDAPGRLRHSREGGKP